jgi:hypothetical protein
MDALRAVAANLGSTALVAATAVQGSLRALAGWAVGIVSQQAELLTILSQSLTLFLLGVLIARLRKPRTRGQSRRAPGLERS